MYEFHFEGFNKEQCDLYLERIGAEYDGQPNLANLDLLIRRHQQSVPFENLALIMNYGTVDLHPDALFRKIVTDRRGGFCFELNGAFLLLLKGLGYDAVGCMARVGIPFIGELLKLDHRGIIVRMEGKTYFCDVGMGGPKADWAVEFSMVPGESQKIRQTRHGQTYWVEDTFEGWKMLKNEGSGSDGSCIIFAPIAMLPMDFEANCADLVGRGNTIFHQVRMVNLCLEDGYLDLRDNTLKICEQGRITEREFPEKEFPQILQEKFGITLQR
ncbi:MAG: arylamine N-acetyltransferase [Parasporobacterium sp.]|nr:arylamine N-acetyltransferase [Parasporobacterium sp.]